jgi:hypothetical protein
MDPYIQAALAAGAGGLGAFLIFRFLVPLLPGDGREQERRARAEREAAEKAAE